MNSSCHIEWLGRMEYGAAWKLQKELVAKRAANQIPDTLVLLEHPHTYTIGIDGHREHLLINRDEMARLNIAYFEVDRGGSVIYHGPGQLVAYLILNLRQHGHSYHQYIEKLEKVIIGALASFKLRAFRERGQPGVWVFCSSHRNASSRWSEPSSYIAKIANVGVKVDDSHITSHGFSLNVQTNLKYFDAIVPSGLSGCNITSLHKIINKPVEIGSVVEPVIQSFCEIFQLEPATDSLDIGKIVSLAQQNVRPTLPHPFPIFGEIPPHLRSSDSAGTAPGS